MTIATLILELTSFFALECGNSHFYANFLPSFLRIPDSLSILPSIYKTNVVNFSDISSIVVSIYDIIFFLDFVECIDGSKDSKNTYMEALTTRMA